MVHDSPMTRRAGYSFVAFWLRISRSWARLRIHGILDIESLARYRPNFVGETLVIFGSELVGEETLDNLVFICYVGFSDKRITGVAEHPNPKQSHHGA